MSDHDKDILQLRDQLLGQLIDRVEESGNSLHINPALPAVKLVWEHGGSTLTVKAVQTDAQGNLQIIGWASGQRWTIEDHDLDTIEPASLAALLADGVLLV